MRDISTLTPQEGAGLWDAVMPTGLKPFQGSAHHFNANSEAPERVLFCSGVERLGVYFNGHIWADCDLQRLELDREKIKEYLLSMGIQLP